MKRTCGNRAALKFAALGLMAAGLVIPAGCPSAGNPVIPPPTTSDSARQIITDYTTAYATARQTQSADAARASVLASLQADASVASAQLGLDGCSIWINFTDGSHAAINTREGFGDGTEFDAAALENIYHQATAGSPTAKIVRLAKNLIPEQTKGLVLRSDCPSTPPSPTSRKVLMLNAVGDTMSKLDTIAYPFMANLLIDMGGWDAGDIVTKSNTGAGRLHCSDFCGLGDYGVVIITTNSMYVNAPENFLDPSSPVSPHLFIQVAPESEYLNMDTLIAVQHGDDPFDVTEAFNKGQLVLTASKMGGLDAPTTSSVYMRDDLWAEYMGVLPNSVIYLAAPDGTVMNAQFKGHGAGEAASWTGPVQAQDAVNAMSLITLMVSTDASSAQALQSGLFPTTSNSGAAQFFASADAALPMYMPTWLDVTTTGAPAETNTLLTSIEYTDSNLCPPVTGSTENIPNFTQTLNGLRPGAEVIVKTQALDVNRNLLADGQATIQLITGTNEVTVNLTTDIHLTVAASETVYDSNSGGPITVTATAKSSLGKPLPGRSIKFTSSIPGLVILDSTPVTTNSEGVAQITGTVENREPWEYAGPSTTTITATATNAQPATCTVDYCNWDLYFVRLSGSSDPYLTGEGTEFASSGIRVYLRVNGTQVRYLSWYGTSSYTRTAVGIYQDVTFGDVLEFEVQSVHADWAFGPAYLHLWNCHSSMTVNVGSGTGITTLTVP